MKIGAGESGIIESGTVASGRHDVCYNVIILNLEKRKALMFHVWVEKYGGLSYRQKEDLNKFSKELGDKVALPIRGSDSNFAGDTIQKLQEKGIEVLPTLKLSTKGLSFNVDFLLEDRKVTVTDRLGNILYEGTPFPPFQEIEIEDFALNDHERLVKKLSLHTDPATGELDAEAQKELNIILGQCDEMGSLEIKLMRIFMTERAAAAGFKNYDAYFNADSRNVTKIRPDSLELVLRKLGGDWSEEFIKAGIDFDAVKITPSAIVEILADCPKALDQFIKALKNTTQFR